MNMSLAVQAKHNEGIAMEKLAMIAAVILPLWNIPLIIRIIKRRSSKDISIVWALGVWVCFLLMFPTGIKSPDTVYKTFTFVNFFFFTFVMIFTVLFHK